MLVTLLCFSFIQAFSQQTILSSGGNSADGAISYSFGQFAFQTYFQSSSSVAQGVQHPFEISSVPSLFSLTNTMIYTDDIFCYNALQDITVGGVEPSVYIQSDAEVNFIAGHSIRFLPGFNAQPGSSVRAFITTTGEFCDGPIRCSIVQLPPEEKSEGIIDSKVIDDLTSAEKKVVVFPNPNQGVFRINLINFENSASICIYNLTGAIFYKTGNEQITQKEIMLPYVQKGIYFVRITSNNEQFVKKIIVR